MQSSSGKDINYNCWLNFPPGSDMIQVAGTDYRDLASYRAATGLDIHSISVSPQFQNESADDFHLAELSVCLGTGTSVGLLEDFDGQAIPPTGPVSIGAYQGSTLSGPLTITQQPHGGRKAVSQIHTFGVGVSGGKGTIFYQWYKDGEAIAGATERLYVTHPLTELDTGTYYVEVGDDEGASITSATAYLEVGPYTLPAVGHWSLWVILAAVGWLVVRYILKFDSLSLKCQSKPSE